MTPETPPPGRPEEPPPAKHRFLDAYAGALAARWRVLASGALWLFVGVWACLHAWSTHGDPFLDAGLQRTGVLTNGPVVDIEKLSRSDGSPEWRVTYEFLDVPGKKFRGSLRVASEAAVRPYERAGNVAVRYLPTDPRVNTRDGARLSTMTMDHADALIAGTAASALPFLYAFGSAFLAARRRDPG